MNPGWHLYSPPGRIRIVAHNGRFSVAVLKPESRDRTAYSPVAYAIENLAAFKLADQPPRRKVRAYLNEPDGAMLATIVVLWDSTGAVLYAAPGYETAVFPGLGD